MRESWMELGKGREIGEGIRERERGRGRDKGEEE